MMTEEEFIEYWNKISLYPIEPKKPEQDDE